MALTLRLALSLLGRIVGAGAPPVISAWETSGAGSNWQTSGALDNWELSGA